MIIDESNFPKEVNGAEIEKSCKELWDRHGINLYDPETPGEIFSVDTPPPYVSASHVHVGHAMSHAQAEFIVRYAQTAQRTERQYHAVEPENRLVARTLEQRWEEALRAERACQEEYDRFLQDQPRQLTDNERAQIVALANDIPKLWHAPKTTAAGRKEVVRLLIERVVVHVQAENERVRVEIAWRGGLTTKHEIIRSVARYESLGAYRQLLKRIRKLRREGMTIARIANRLNEDGYRTPRSRKGYTSTSVRKLMSRCRQRARATKASYSQTK